MIKCGGAVEFDKDINVAVCTQLIPRGRAKKRQAIHSVALADLLQVLRQQAED